MNSQPLAGGQLFGGRDMTDPRTLNGAAGAEPTLVKPGLSRISANSLMLTALVEKQRRTVVWGGLGYSEFGKFATLRDGSPAFFAEDPVGRLVDEDQTYLSADTFYLDVHTREPFDALERYGLAMRLANNARPNVYDFPVLCGWSVGHMSKLPNINNSAKLVKELDHANTCGLTKYTKVAIRLEPDKYHFDTEQGWWDDAHMRKFGHLVPPYESIAKWSEALEARNGVPYIYMQLGMPSDDFTRKFPQYMLFNDGSEVDRRTPGMKRRNKHPHHQPYVTYDYTDEEFSKHFVKVWSKLRADGIRGVKVDYPATAWRPEGGFDDRYATCNSTYRRAFRLLREAMGKDGLIDERNIGESGRPCLDVTAGLVDTQRTWADSSSEKVKVTFRQDGRQPELWDPISGKQRDLPQFTIKDGRTTVGLEFEPHGSMFIVFAKPVVKSKGKNFAELKTVQEVKDPWAVQFDREWFYPLDGLSGKQAEGAFVFDKLVDWTGRSEPAVKYFAGTAKYSTEFLAEQDVVDGGQYWLDLGVVNISASVRLNGVDLGVVWCSPWRVDISGAIRKGVNKLEIEVVNQWPNRLIGDGKLPVEKRRTRTNIMRYYWKPRKSEHELLPSGLLGPVRLMKVNTN